MGALLWTAWTLTPIPGDARASGSVKLKQVPDHVIKAVVAAEEGASAQERHVTMERLAGAFWFAVTRQNLQDSAIAQRMVHNQRSQDPNFLQRLGDLLVTSKVELTKPSEWVLEKYLNVLDFGRGPEGIQAGAQEFFGKNVQELTVSEGAYLAAAIQRADDSAGSRSDMPTRWRTVIDGLRRSGTLTATQVAVQRFPEVRTSPSSAGPAGGGTAMHPASVRPANAALAPRPKRARQECPPGSIICEENLLPGTPYDVWQVAGAGDPDIQGYPTQISVNHGETVQFKVDTPATDYRLDIYRIGYYGGDGARHVDTVQPSAALPQTQPACLTDASTGLVDCGNWDLSASWAVPATAVSGVYFAKLVREDGTAGESQMFFVVRDDGRASDVVFKTSDTTWQAYNRYGGNSLYFGSPANRAYKVSYNRPITTRGISNGPPNFFYNAEYPMVRWLEANAYDVSYISSIDATTRPSTLLGHDLFLSVGHDEYWSNEMRNNVTAARDDGVNMAFFSANEVFWKTRWENSIDSSNTPFRTMVCYKETLANAKIDPSPQWTGTWMDPRFSPPSDGGKPQNQLTGTLFIINGIVNDAITVPATYAPMRLWRNTSIANLTPGQVATLPTGTLGFEWDNTPDNGFAPPGLARFSETTLSYTNKVLLDFGGTYGAGTATHHLTLYRQSSGGGLVFGAGTIQWPWGLDGNHDRSGTPTDIRMQQATVNLFADMNAQPATLQPGLVPAIPSTDTAPPTSAITVPLANASVKTGTPFTIKGTASDTGGGVVAGVEVSVDGGSTWNAATGLTNWQYNWIPQTVGQVTIMARAVDDIGNLQSTPTSVTVRVSVACPCTLWPDTTVPAVVQYADSRSVELGVKFQASQEGAISGIRFYKGSLNTGTHIGNLWSSTGQLLAQATFTNETASGWQTVKFATPVQVTPGTTYVASYFAPNGRFALNTDYFTSTYSNPPLTALSSSGSGGNGVYKYNASSTFPSSTYRSSNYWVDVVFAPTSIWPSTAVPAVENAPGTDPLVVGVRFSSEVSGTIRGIRFYKGSQNTGTHTASLWTNSGQLLARATFTNETASGWQQVLFSTPVHINANTTYIASNYVPTGHFSYTQNYFATDYLNSPLVALASGAQGNGLYRYTTDLNKYPNQSFKMSNYWVDVVFYAD
ncbi:DUF4082 domain-containing protein [Nonomuraea sp. NPDC049695]|uniref:DUF4082 domain-containing protein n=1 Tax=Nonomuraea sp. NPDC049695 TaxID=3154734 RepID=UPI00343F632A